ncbi:hypothetical protein EYS14_13475 [Alteromonadaceae bacterium M269]|nr:hypothetical protein EYS14_13475 [Alteromonadaceae bacterium M269]
MRNLYVSALLLCGGVAAADTAIVISPHVSVEANTAQIKTVKQVFKALPLRESLMVFSGDNASVITRVDTPEDDKYTHARARMKLRHKELAPLDTFDVSLKNTGRAIAAIDAPVTLREIARYHESVKDIVIMGSVFYDSPSYAQLSMVDGAVPSMGYITVSPSVSPFGTKDRDYLNGKRIHWLLPEPIKNSLHSEAVMQFWYSYIKALGGELVTFSHNREVMIDRLINHAKPLSLSFPDDKSGKREMRRIIPALSHQELYEQPVSEKVSLNDTLDTAQPLMLGIRWQHGKGEPIDLDMHVTDGGDTLYYQHQRTLQGIHIKQARKLSDTVFEQYETVELFNSVPDTLSIAINLYYVSKFDEAPVTGALRIRIGNKVYKQPFVFDALDNGNLGADTKAALKTGHPTPHTQLFRIEDIVTLSKGEVSL